MDPQYGLDSDFSLHAPQPPRSARGCCEDEDPEADQAMSLPRPAAEIGTASNIYKDLDANKDGTVTRQEIMTALKTRQDELKAAGKADLVKMYSDLFVHFEQHDLNLDDGISLSEFMTYFDAVKEKFHV